jgi:hypothetical protein
VRLILPSKPACDHDAFDGAERPVGREPNIPTQSLSSRKGQSTSIEGGRPDMK